MRLVLAEGEELKQREQQEERGKEKKMARGCARYHPSRSLE